MQICVKFKTQIQVKTRSKVCKNAVHSSYRQSSLFTFERLIIRIFQSFWRQQFEQQESRSNNRWSSVGRNEPYLIIACKCRITFSIYNIKKKKDVKDDSTERTFKNIYFVYR